MRTSRRASLTRVPDVARSLASPWTADQAGDGPVLPAVRIAPARELAAAALAAPLLRQAQRLARWVGASKPVTARGLLRPADAIDAIAQLDLAAEGHFGAAADGSGMATRPSARDRAARLRSAGDVRELHLAWRTAIGAGLIALTGRRACARPDALDCGDPDTVFAAWQGALRAALASGPADVNEELEGLAMLLYVTGLPVRMDSLAEAFAAATRARRVSTGQRRARDPGAAAARMSQALEVLADLGVADVGVDDEDEQLTVALTPLGIAGMRQRLAAAGFAAPLAGCGAGSDAAGLLAGLSGYDAEDGELEIAAWLAQRTPQQAAAELLDAASVSSPGARGAAFAIIDRLGKQAIPRVQAAMADPLLRPHAAIWLRERGLQATLSPAEKAWLLVDLGAGLLEDANPGAVAADLLPELPAAEQAELVADLWQVSHPGLVGLLTTLAEHHPDPQVAKAARKAAFKARSHYLGGR